MDVLRSFVRRRKAKWLNFYRKLRAEDTGYIYYHKRVLFIFGFWPSDISPRTASLGETLRYLNSRFVFGITCVLAFIVLPLGAYECRDGPIGQVFEQLLFDLFMISTVIIMSALLYQTRNFDDILEKMELMRECGRKYKIQTPASVTSGGRKLLGLMFLLYLWMVVNVQPISGVLVYLMFKNRTIIIGGWYPYDEKASPYFELTAVTLIFVLTSIVAVYTNICVMSMSFVVQPLNQLKILNFNLQNIKATHNSTTNSEGGNLLKEMENVNAETSSKYCLEKDLTDINPKINSTTSSAMDMENDENTKTICEEEHLNTMLKAESKNENAQDLENMYAKVSSTNESNNEENGFSELECALVQCVKHHQSIISLVRAVEEAFGKILLFTVVENIIIYAIGCLLVWHNGLNNTRTLFVLTLVLVSGTAMLAMSVLANRLTDESEAVREYVFGCDWQDKSEGFKRSVRIMISVSNQPLVICVGGFVPLSLETFHSMVQAAYSYYTFLATTSK